MNSLSNEKKLDLDNFLNNYIKFMTTPDSHNDVYAATAHRMFFANFVKGIKPNQCADNDGHNTDAIDGIINVIPITLANQCSKEQIFETINVIRKSETLPIYGLLFSNLLTMVLNGNDLKESVSKTAKIINFDV